MFFTPCPADQASRPTERTHAPVRYTTTRAATPMSPRSLQSTSFLFFRLLTNLSSIKDRSHSMGASALTVSLRMGSCHNSYMDVWFFHYTISSTQPYRVGVFHLSGSLMVIHGGQSCTAASRATKCSPAQSGITSILPHSRVWLCYVNAKVQRYWYCLSIANRAPFPYATGCGPCLHLYRPF